MARKTARQPLDVSHFYRDQGVEFIQFAPIVERLPDAAALQRGLKLAGPARLDGKEPHTDVTPWSVIPEEYG